MTTPYENARSSGELDTDGLPTEYGHMIDQLDERAFEADTLRRVYMSARWTDEHTKTDAIQHLDDLVMGLIREIKALREEANSYMSDRDLSLADLRRDEEGYGE